MGGLFGSEQTVPQTQFTNQSSNQTTNQSQSANQAASQAYSANLLAQALGGNAFNLANTIYGTPSVVPGLQVAGLTPGQQTGIDTLSHYGMNVFGAGLLPFGSEYLRSGADMLSGLGAAYVNQGAGVMNNAALPISGSDVGGFLNPFQDYVTQNLQNIFGQQNLANRIGGTAAAGGVGADRSAVGASLLAKQQGLAAGQTYADIYNRALQAAQMQKAQQLQAGQGLVGAGSQYGALGAQRAALGLPTIQSAFGNIQTGLQAASIPQAQQQAVNQALYQQQLGQYQDPFLRLSSQIGAIPSVAGLGGTGMTTGATNATGNLVSVGNQGQVGQGTTTYPAPPILPQIAGLGGLALGIGSLFSDRRAKTDIQKVGKDKSTGLKMYAFRYKGDPKSYPKVVGPMAQDVKKKYPHAVKKFNRGGQIQHFQDGGGEDSYGEQQSQDTNYMDDFTDVGLGQGSDAPTAPYASQGATWDLKRIFSPDRLQRAQRALALMQKATAQSQVARPRVAPITFPQTPWKSGPGAFGGSGYQRGGRLAIIPQAIPYIRQEGGRVDAATADSWGGYKVWRPGMRRLQQDWGPGVDEYGRQDRAAGYGESGGFHMRQMGPDPHMRYPVLRPGTDRVYRRGGFIRSYQDGGEVEAPPMDALSSPMPHATGPGGITPIPGADIPLPVARPTAAGLGETPPAAPAASPAGGGGFLGGLFGGGGSGAGGVSPAMALMQAGLGMLAASGQRDARGLPMSPLGAIGAGGMSGVSLFQQQQEAARKDALARQSQAQSIGFRQAQLAETKRHHDLLEAYRRDALALKSGEEGIKTIQTPYGPKSVIKDPDTGEYKDVPVVKPPPPMVPIDPNAPSAQAPSTSAASYEENVIKDPPLHPPLDNGVTSEAIRLNAERYLQTGKFPPGLYRRESKMERDAIQNDAARIAKARGMNLQEVADLWKYSPRHAAWIMGVDGRQAGNLGTLIDHLDTMKVLTTALQNKDNQTYNQVKNKIAKWTGKEYPTNVEAGAPIVGAEIMKAVGAAGAGTGAEREVAGLNLGDLAKSPRQFAGAIDTVQRLAAGQLRTKYRQAEAIAGKDEAFKKRIDTLVGKRALEVLTSLDEGPQSSSAAQPLQEHSPQRQQALDWLKANPNDPRAPAIRKKLGLE